MWNLSSKSSKQRHGFAVSRQLTLGILILFLLSAAVLSWLPWVDASSQDLNHRFLPLGSPGHVLGTDDLGRDQAARLIAGSRSALAAGAIPVLGALILGLMTGLAAGYGPRWLDRLLELLMNALLSIPTVLLCLVFLASFGYGLTQVLLALVLVFTPVIQRLVRSEVLRCRHAGYVEAAETLAVHHLFIIWRHILPQIASLLWVQAAILFAVAIGVEAALSFLGIGTQAPDASWGGMLRDARNYIFIAPHLAIIPGIALSLVIAALNIEADHLAESANLRR